MELNATLYSDNMRVTIKRAGTSVWAAIHEAGQPYYTRALTIALSDEKPAEIAAWEALSAALAAQDVKEEAL